jgi:hypothetical protein
MKSGNGPTRVSWRNVRRLLWLIPLIFALLIGLGLGLVFLRSELTTFRPRLPGIMRLVEEQRTATPKLPAFLSRCLEHEAGNDIHITRRLLTEFGVNDTTRRRRMARQWCWWISLKWHLNIEDRRLIYCRFIPDNSGNLGIQHVAQKLYQKPLTALNDRELASLVIVSRAPSVYLRDGARLDRDTEHFLKEMNWKPTKTHNEIPPTSFSGSSGSVP